MFCCGDDCSTHTPVTYMVHHARDLKKRMEKEHLHGKGKDTPAGVAQICADFRPFCTDAGACFPDLFAEQGSRDVSNLFASSKSNKESG